MKIAFFGTSPFGIPTLETLHGAFGIEIVFTGVAKPAKRGQKLQNTPVYDKAQALGIKNIHTAEKLLPEHIPLLQDIDYAVVVSYGLLLPTFILNAVKVKCLNIHPSKLPLFRGAAPIERTLESGASETEVCVIAMTKELDAGDILAKREYTILPDDNSITLHEKFSRIGAELVMDLLKNGTANITPIVQDSSRATYAKKISKSELEISNPQNALSAQIINRIKAFASCGYCYILHNGKRIKIIEAQFTSVRLTEYDIICPDGFVSPSVIRPEGKKTLQLGI